MRAARTLSLLLLLQSRGRVSATELAALLEVSVRTVHRDVDHLSAAGVPVYATRGRDGGFELLAGWQTQLSGLTAVEADALTLAALPSVAHALGLRTALQAAELKLAASNLADPATLRSRIHIDPTRWFFDDDHPDVLRPLLDAVMADRRVRIRYRRQSGVSMYTIDPHGLVLKAGVWYLVALSRRKRRTYRVAHIEEVELSDAQFARSEAFDLAAVWAESAADYEAGVVTSMAHIRMTVAALHRLAATSGAIASALPPHKASSRSSSWIDATIPIEGLEHAAQLLLDPDIEVLGPPELRDRIAAAVAQLGERYTRRTADGVAATPLDRNVSANAGRGAPRSTEQTGTDE